MKNLSLQKTLVLSAGFFLLNAAIPAAVIADDSKMQGSKASADDGKMQGGSMQGGKAPADARDPNANSGGYEYRGMAGWEETDAYTFSKVIVDQFEYRDNNGNDTLRWDVQGWRGKDYKKIWFKFEGEDDVANNEGDVELQTLYSRSVAAFWDFQVGTRFDIAYNSASTDSRFFGVIGFQGLAPYWFEVESAIFLSDTGNVSARFVSTYDLLFSQRLILQPRLEVNASIGDDRAFGVGSGINDLQLGFRLRYEYTRKLAPYVGVEWQRQFGQTANFTRADGAKPENTALVAGIRFWF